MNPRQLLMLLACAAALLASPVVAGPMPDLREWRYRRAITVPDATAEFGEIVVDGSLYETTVSGFRDVRVTSPSGQLVPHVIREWPASTSEQAVPASIVNRSAVPGRLTRLEVHTAVTQPHNRLELEIGGGAFSRRVTVEGSDDRQRWLVLTSTIVSRTAAQGAAPVILSYPNSTYRYIRLSLLDQGEPALHVMGAALILTRVTPAREDVWYAGLARVHTDPATRTTTVTTDLNHRNIPVTRITLRVIRPAAFVRSIAVDISDDSQQWRSLAQRRVARTRDQSTGRPVTVSFPEGVGRYLRVTIANGDSPPLEVGSVEVAGIRRTILFPIDGGSAFWLYTGAASAPTAEYDLEQVLSLRNAPPRPAPARLESIEPNPAYAPPVVSRPWTEERPWLLWSALAVSAIVILGIIAATLRGLRSAA